VTAASGLVIVDKPPGLTSHDVVARIRRMAGTRRVGHAGTLDPMATGVLVVGVEKATRLLGHLALTSKEYSATIRLGQATDTDDADGEIIAAAAAGGVTAEALSAAARQLTGEIQQVPPGISAIKVAGKRAYRLTREGAPPRLAARTVIVTSLRIIAVRPLGDLMDVDVAVTCSSGTYIRAIARDLGAALEVGGHLTALRRTRVGPYLISAAATLDELAVSLRVIPLAEAAAAAFPRRDLTAEQARMISRGVALPAVGRPAQAAQAAQAAEGGTTAGAGPAAPGGAPSGGPVAAFGPDGTLIALLTEEDGQARSLAVFVP
jgi:tRNA pseudouridine55 synthase